MKPRWWLLWGKWTFIGFSLLAIVMIATSVDGWGTAKAPQAQLELPAKAASSRQNKTVKRSPDESRVEFERLDPEALQQNKGGKIGNVFGSTSWYVPPPPPPQVILPPPVPTAPPMPFTYLGLYDGARGKVIMLVKGDQVYTVSVGDVIENTYRVDRVENGIVDLTYLPLNIKQSITTGNSL
jgi:hypothetical protein